ncbi:MAG: CvpA family protein [Bacteroidales bacterium]|nr:CvpA family protein [Bacteroidales bacterium]
MTLFAIHIDVSFSLFGVLILGILAWGGYRGYKRGGIIMGLSLFALAGGMVISGALSRMTYMYFMSGMKTPVPEVFGSIVLAATFAGAIWFSVFVQKAVHVRVLDVASDRTNNIVGSVLGVVKFFIIAAIYSTVILNLNCKGNFLPDRDANSKIMKFSKIAITKGFKMIRMDYHFDDSDPCSSKYNEYMRKLNDTTDIQTQPINDSNTNNTGINFPDDTQNNTSTNTQPNNNQNNTDQHPVVDDVNNP